MSYEYEFVRIELTFGWFGSSNPKSDYQVIIRKFAEDRWRLVQIHSPAVAGYGKARYFELIFEREKSPNYQS